MQEFLIYTALIFFNLICVMLISLLIYLFIAIKKIQEKAQQLTVFASDRIYRMTDISGLGATLLSSLISNLPNIISKRKKKGGFWSFME